jgi:hypothetical protein
MVKHQSIISEETAQSKQWMQENNNRGKTITVPEHKEQKMKMLRFELRPKKYQTNKQTVIFIPVCK